MCTPWTTSRLIRWRRKEWSSSVFCCRNHLSDHFWVPTFADIEPDTLQNPSISHHLFSQPMIYKEEEISTSSSHDESSPAEKSIISSSSCSHSSSGRISSHVETNPKLSTTSDLSMKRSSAVGSETETSEFGNDPNCPNFRDGDYIVFCFKEGGAFDIVKDETSHEIDSVDGTIVRLRPINRKKQLIYGEEEGKIVDKKSLDHTLLLKEEEEEVGSDSTNEKPIGSFDPTNEWESNISDEKGDDVESVYFDSESPVRIIKVVDERKVKGHDLMVSTDSSPSLQSESSGGSFAFPILSREWTGSPIKMPNLDTLPKLEAMNLRKHRRLGLHCCKF